MTCKDLAISCKLSEKLANARDYLHGKSNSTNLAAVICQAAHLCKSLTDQDLMHEDMAC